MLSDSEESAYGVFAYTRSQGPRWIFLGSAPRIDHAVQAWRSEIAKPRVVLSPAEAEAEARIRGAHLRELIWDPMAEHVSEVSELIVIPAGSVNLVPLSVLPTSEDSFLVETGPLLRYAGTERDLDVGDESEEESTPSLLAMGGPDFDTAGEDGPGGWVSSEPQPYRGPRIECARFRDIVFEELPGARAEIESVQRMWEQTRGAKAEVTARTGAASTEAAFKNLAPEHAMVHLATHGFYVPGDCSEGGESPFSGTPLDALLRCGVAFAGANLRSTQPFDGTEDGILTAEEIATLNLTAVDLVVVSACESGVGELSTVDGVFGLQRAFRTAGVRRLVLTMWPVRDQAAREWMEAFYAGLLEQGLSAPLAAREASLAMLESRRAGGRSTHPHFWGAFLLTGD